MGETGEAIALMRNIARAVQKIVADSARSSRLRQPDFIALSRIVASDGMTGVELGKAMSLNASSVTELADRLEASGHCKRVRPDHDRRLVILQATPRGRRVVTGAYGPVWNEMTELVDRLDPRELDVVTRFMNDISSTLERLSPSEKS